MKLKRVISGGQTGADQTGVECAAKLGLATGGTMPRGYRTEHGQMPEWGKMFGLVESWSESYLTRTKQNVKDAEATLWFGSLNSPGYWATVNADKTKPFIVNPTDLREIAEMYEVINIAGNRVSKNPGVVKLVQDAFATLERITV